MTRIPFLDLKAHHDPIRAEVMESIAAVVDKNAFAGGPFVASFEEDFARYCEVPHCLGVGNGTDALWVALLALGIGPGDEVITVPMTFMATAEAITYTGATPVFVDIDPVSYTLDPKALESAITPRTRAVIPVHLFGQCADMDPILEIAQKHNLKVVEDAAQAQGARYKGRPAGSLGDVGCFSFYPGKNLGAWGEAGAVVTRDPDLHRRMAMFRDHGQSRKYHHDVVGWNLRMDGIQAAVLKVKLKYLNRANEGRRRAAAQYGKHLSGVEGLVLPREMEWAHHIWHIYPVRVPDRDRLMERLGGRGIGTGIHYPIPVHRQEAYAHLGLGPGSYPVSEQCGAEFLSLPMFPELKEEQVDTVIAAVREELGC